MENKKCISIKKGKKYKEIKNSFILLKQKQRELETEDELIFLKIPIYTAVKYKIMCDDFIFHESMILRRKFYETPEFVVDRKSIINIISNFLESDTTYDINGLSTDTINKLSAAYKKMKTKSTL